MFYWFLFVELVWSESILTRCFWGERLMYDHHCFPSSCALQNSPAHASQHHFPTWTACVPTVPIAVDSGSLVGSRVQPGSKRPHLSLPLAFDTPSEPFRSRQRHRHMHVVQPISTRFCTRGVHVPSPGDPSSPSREHGGMASWSNSFSLLFAPI